MTTNSESFATSGHLIAASELIARLEDPRLRIVDASFELQNSAAGAELYAAGHVPGAVHLDLDRDLSGPRGQVGGRHPLPDMSEFAAKLGNFGIGRDNDVVVYDQAGAMYAARAWWLLRYAGHQRVRFLDGGLAEYRRAGGSVTSDLPAHAPTTFELELAPDMLATAAEVNDRFDDGVMVLLDARAPERFRGETEPLDPRAGHIPGARNLPFTDAIEGGKLLSQPELARRLGTTELAGEDVVAYCGSGVSAAHLILSLAVAGLPGVRLYPGSWSEWSSDPTKPIATGA